MYDDWYKIFSEEYTENGDPAKEQMGEKFTIETKNGEMLTIYKREDGWIQVENSAVKNMTKAIRPDVFCDFLWGK